MYTLINHHQQEHIHSFIATRIHS